MNLPIAAGLSAVILILVVAAVARQPRIAAAIAAARSRGLRTRKPAARLQPLRAGRGDRTYHLGGA